MLVKNIILLSFLGLASATGFIIPEGTADGIYEHYVDDNGVDVHKKIADPRDYSKTDLKAYAEELTPNRLTARGAFVSCNPARDLNHGDTDAANADLDWQCDHNGWAEPKHNYYAIRGEAVAFFCNFSWIWRNSCSSGERQQRSHQITDTCGWYNSGWWQDGDRSLGYDRGRCFCGECV